MSSRPRIGAQDLLEIISLLLETGSDDSLVAQVIASVGISESLTPQSIALIKNAGAGDKTLKALGHLVQESSQPRLIQESSIPSGAAPKIEETQRQVNRIAGYVGTYVQTMVDFNCRVRARVYLSQRSSDRDGVSLFRGLPDTSWTLTNTLDHVIRFVGGRELISKASAKDFEEENGLSTFRKVQAWSQGEFGALLAITFAQSSKAHFRWDHWETANGRRLIVLRYEVARPQSQFAIGTQALVQGQWQEINVLAAYQGLVYADRDSGEIVRFTARTMKFPQDYAIGYGDLMLNYAPVNLSGKTFLLLTQSVAYLKTRQYCSLIQKDFSEYRKFAAESRFLAGP